MYTLRFNLGNIVYINVAGVMPFDVIFIDRCYCQYDCGISCSHIFYWQMLLPFIMWIDVLPTYYCVLSLWLMLLPIIYHDTC